MRALVEVWDTFNHRRPSEPRVREDVGPVRKAGRNCECNLSGLIPLRGATVVKPFTTWHPGAAPATVMDSEFIVSMLVPHGFYRNETEAAESCSMVVQDMYDFHGLTTIV